MAFDPGNNPYNPLLIGAIAVVVALVAFLVFRTGDDTRQQAGIQSPPAVTTPAPNAAPPGEPNPPPTTPDPAPAKQQSPSAL